MTYYTPGIAPSTAGHYFMNPQLITVLPGKPHLTLHFIKKEIKVPRSNFPQGTHQRAAEPGH